MLNALRPFISRMISPLIASLLAFLAVKGIQLPEDASGHLTEYAVIVLIALMQMLNGPIHKLIDKKANPGDAAATSIAAIEKKEADRMDAA